MIDTETTLTLPEMLEELHRERLDLTARELPYRQRIAEIEDEMRTDPCLTAVKADVADLESKIRNEVVTFGESVKTEHLQAVFVKGRTSWDTKGLDAYAKTNPDVLVYKVEGAPSAQIREVKK